MTPHTDTSTGALKKAAPYDVEAIRRDFPIMNLVHRGQRVAYLDSAATTQKPQAVIDAIQRYYTEQNANVHRGVHFLSETATRVYEEARIACRQFLNAADAREIVFCRGATEAINLVASSYGRTGVGPGDEIIVTTMEHHSNIVPWQMLCNERGARLRVVPMSDQGELDLEAYHTLLGSHTKLVSVVHVSNALGTINPVGRMIELAHDAGIPVLVDGAQAVPHKTVDVRALDCDFYVFSGHKVYGPTGIGVLYGKADLLDAMPPYQGGGDMIRTVSFDKTTYNDIPYKFEAGTPNIAGAVGLGAAIEYLSEVGLEVIAAHEKEMLAAATELVGNLPGVRLIGQAREKAAVLSFVIEGVHPHDIGTILDQMGVAIRTGHHCTQPVMDRLGVPATARASFGLYNNRDDIERLARGLTKVMEVFG